MLLVAWTPRESPTAAQSGRDFVLSLTAQTSAAPHAHAVGTWCQTSRRCPRKKAGVPTSDTDGTLVQATKGPGGLVERSRVSVGALYWTAAVVSTVALIALSDAVQTGDFVLGFDLRPTILCISLVGFNILSYVGWPSRWNVVAHAQLAFSVVAFIIPIYFLDTLNKLSSQALDLYYQVCAVGLAVSFLGALLGRAAGTAKRIDRLTGMRDFGSFETNKKIVDRVLGLSVLCIGGRVCCTDR
jgi:hypothetical protein